MKMTVVDTNTAKFKTRIANRRTAGRPIGDVITYAHQLVRHNGADLDGLGLLPEELAAYHEQRRIEAELAAKEKAWQDAAYARRLQEQKEREIAFNSYLEDRRHKGLPLKQ